MESFNLTLSDAEQHYYQELFSACDVDNLGKALAPHVAELFRNSHLPADKLEQITEICGTQRLGHFNRTQFFKALKLIAAAQNGLPVKADVLDSGIEFPLPKFNVEEFTNDVSSPSRQILMKLVNSSTESTEKSNSHFRVLKPEPGSPQISSPRDSASPRESPSSRDRVAWISFHNEETQLEWSHSDHDQLLGQDEGESSERHSSDEDCDIWTISAEQEEYYTNQFKVMQTDLTRKITGSIAKNFFERSKLPVQELSKIWQLSDIDKDGALTLAEFCTAMHLVVLRRNNIELPDILPPSLVPKIHTTSNNLEVSAVAAPQIPPHQNSKPASPTDQLSPQNKEWTKFAESPTSTLSSPGVKPVSFDFSAASVEQDPQILHPVALRVTPDCQTVIENDTTADKMLSHQCTFQSIDDATDPLTKHFVAPGPMVTHNLPLQGPKKEPPPPPPPRPKRNHTRSSSLDLNRMSKGESPFLHHSGMPPPAVPPRISPSAAGAFEVYRKPAPTVKTTSSLSLDFDITSAAAFDSSLSIEPLENSVQNEIEVEKKRYASAPSVTGVSELATDKRELQIAVCKYRERNLQLTRLNSELSQELSEVMEERIALEIQLEHMKPLSF